MLNATGFLRIVLLTISFVILVTGCATHVSKPDGPPSYYVDVSKIPNATPKKEPLSKIGNQPYHVFGKKYYVMNSSKNYVERGVASWYGTKFHQRHTSSGEKYDMLAMTAAHKSLPLPTYVEVTNLKNKKKVIVKVNDRGPFESNRIIDLSYAAAKKLDIVGHGTAPVEIRAINPYEQQGGHGLFSLFAKNHGKKAPVYTAKNSSTKRNAPVYLQVGSFQYKSNALKLRSKLMTYVSSPIQITKPSNKLYRVQIGPLKDTRTIAEINKQLKALGLSSRKMVV